MLDGLCMMGKIKKISKDAYAGIDFEAEAEEVSLPDEPIQKRGRKKKDPVQVVSDVDDNMSFSEDVVSAVDKINSILEGGDILERPLTIEYLEKTVSGTGRKICDAMNTRVIHHKVTIGANQDGTQNIELEHERRSYRIGFSLKFVENRIEFYRLSAHPRNGNLGHETLDFDGYKDAREFILKNR